MLARPCGLISPYGVAKRGSDLVRVHAGDDTRKLFYVKPLFCIDVSAKARIVRSPKRRDDMIHIDDTKARAAHKNWMALKADLGGDDYDKHMAAYEAMVAWHDAEREVHAARNKAA